MIKKFKANIDDPLVIPAEYKMGLVEEKEHKDVIGNDKEALKKIVLAHLAENKNYYSDLKSCNMKAEEEKSIINFKKPEGTKLAPTPSLDEIKGGLHLHQKKAGEKPKVVPGTAAPKTREYLEKQGLLKKAEEDSDKEKMKSTMGFIKHQDADRTRARQNQMKMPPMKAEETLPGASSARPNPKSVPLSGKPGTPPKTEADLPSERLSADEVCADCGKKLSTSLIEKAEEELGKDKVEEAKNKTIVDKFAEEEKAKPARFEAEPTKV